MHPFGRYGLEAGPVAFHHLWNRLREHCEAGTLDEYSMGAQLARAGRVTMPPETPRVDFEHFDWAVHFDASQFAAYLREFALKLESAARRRVTRCCAMATTERIARFGWSRENGSKRTCHRLQWLPPRSSKTRCNRLSYFRPLADVRPRRAMPWPPKSAVDRAVHAFGAWTRAGPGAYR